jgi:hypothetical protein
VASSRLYRFMLRRWWLTFLLMGVSFVAFGLVSLDLLRILTANFEFLSMYGLDAVREGGLVQLLGLIFSGYAAAFFYLVFKLCEKVLVDRLSLANPKGIDS